MQKVIIAGSRTFDRYDIVRRTLNQKFTEPFIVVSGCANGADKLGERYAREYNLQVELHPADWSNLQAVPCHVKYNSRGPYNALAGHNRNREMLQSVLDNPDGGCLVAFWDGQSAGTRNMINIAREAGLTVHVILC
ncbi:MAG: DUF2493 domain-containing protein [Bacteroidaceae bacterium]|nr:DUF2493 domain-containing protein [Bacteroidaceae bacterium]